MPRPGQRIPDSHRERVLQWLAQHPGDHRPTEIAEALGWEGYAGSHRAAVAARGLATASPPLAVRGQRQAINGNRPHNTYGITPAGRRVAAEPIEPARTT